MPVARVQMPDGRVARIEVPEGTTPEQAEAMAAELTANVPGGATKRFLKGLDTGVGMSQLGVLQRLGMRSEEDVQRAREEAAPLTGTTAGRIGETVGKAAPWAILSSLVPGGSMVRTVLSQGLFGGLQGAMEPTAGEGEDSIKNAFYGAGGGALGGAAAHGLGRLLTPVPGVARSRLDLADRARQAGVPISAAQITDDPILKAIEKTAGASPEAEAAKAAALNRMAARAIGITDDVDALTPDVLQAAIQQNSATRQALAQNTVLNTNAREFLDQARQITDDYSSLSPASRRDLPVSIRRHLIQLRDWAQRGAIPGEEYQRERSVISGLARESKGTAQNFYSRIVDAMDSARPPQVADQWDAINTQYRNLVQLNKPGNIDQFGNVKGAALWSAAKGQRGNSELADIAAFAKAFPAKDPVSTFNSRVTHPLAVAGLGGLTNTGVSAYYGTRDPKELGNAFMFGATAATLGPKLLQAGVNNPMMSQYLTRGLIGGADVAPYFAPAGQIAAQAVLQGRQQ